MVHPPQGYRPQRHDASHEDGGRDEISVAALSGDLADAQDPKAHALTHVDGGADEITSALDLAAIPATLTGKDADTLDGSHLADIPGGIWTLETTLSPSAVLTISTGTLAVHDLWMVILDLTFDAARTLDLRFNGDAGANYDGVYVNGGTPALVNYTARDGILAVYTAGSGRALSIHHIRGRRDANNDIQACFNTVPPHYDGYSSLTGIYTAATGDLTSMTWRMGAGSFTGTIKVYYMDY